MKGNVSKLELLAELKDLRPELNASRVMLQQSDQAKARSDGVAVSISSTLYNVTLSELARKLQGQATFALIDIRSSDDTRSKYNIIDTPTTLILRTTSWREELESFKTRKPSLQS